MIKTYAGIGSRKTPPHILNVMTGLAMSLARENWTLRSGGADGADYAFEVGAGDNKEIYLPWKNFNKSISELYPPSDKAFLIAEQHHPSFKFLKPAVKKLHARNVHQILGWTLHQSSLFVVCWTKDGAEHANQTSKETGGTGQAIRIASAFNIPIFNLKNEGSLDKLVEFVSCF